MAANSRAILAQLGLLLNIPDLLAAPA